MGMVNNAAMQFVDRAFLAKHSMAAFESVLPACTLSWVFVGFFQSIVRDGSSCGIYFLVTANTQNTLSFRISQHMKAALCLRMPDKGDYAPIVGRTNGLEPENHPGRGLLKADPPLEFQIALPANHVSEIRRVSEIRNTIAQMKQQWDGKRAPAIPVMPTPISLPLTRSTPSDIAVATCSLTAP